MDNADGELLHHLSFLSVTSKYLIHVVFSSQLSTFLTTGGAPPVRERLPGRRHSCGNFTSSIIVVNVCLLVSLGQKVSFSTADNINIGLADDAYHDENEEQESHDEEDVWGGRNKNRAGHIRRERRHPPCHCLPRSQRQAGVQLDGVVYDCSNNDNNILSKPILPLQQA